MRKACSCQKATESLPIESGSPCDNLKAQSNETSSTAEDDTIATVPNTKQPMIDADGASDAELPCRQDQSTLESGRYIVKEAQGAQSSHEQIDKPVPATDEQYTVLRTLPEEPIRRLPGKDQDTASLQQAILRQQPESNKPVKKHQVLGKRRRQFNEHALPVKRLQLEAPSNFEFDKKCLSPSIFVKKTNLPSKIASKGSSILLPQNQTTSRKALEQTFQGQTRVLMVQNDQQTAQMGNAKVALPHSVKLKDPSSKKEDYSLSNYDANMCVTQPEVQQGCYRAFDSYLDMVSVAYYGLPAGYYASQHVHQNQLNIQSTPLLKRTTDHQSSEGNSSEAMQTNQNNTQQQYHQRPNPAFQTLTRSLNLGHGRQQDSKRFRMTTLDMLCNPLRTDHPFEIWAPKEIALFETCMCRFGKRFNEFTLFIKTKTEAQIYEFYRCWKQTDHYQIWKAKDRDYKIKQQANQQKASKSNASNRSAPQENLQDWGSSA